MHAGDSKTPIRHKGRTYYVLTGQDYDQHMDRYEGGY
jgi:hypothetical protein